MVMAMMIKPEIIMLVGKLKSLEIENFCKIKKIGNRYKPLKISASKVEFGLEEKLTLQSPDLLSVHLQTLLLFFILG